VAGNRRLQAAPVVRIVRLGEVRDVLNRVHRADCAGDGQASIDLDVESGWRLGRGPGANGATDYQTKCQEEQRFHEV